MPSIELPLLAPQGTAREVFITSDFIGRVAALPMHALDALQAARAVQLAERIVHCDAALPLLDATASAALHGLIGEVIDGPYRRSLLTLRRDLHNRRLISAARLRTLRDGMPADVWHAVGRLWVALERRASLAARYQTTFLMERVAGSQALRGLLDDEVLMSGLALASPALFRNAARYRASEAALTSARREQLERGLLRYAARMSHKATPFGPFCAILPARLISPCGHRTPAMRINGRRVIRSVCTPSKAVLPAVLASLTSDPAIRGQLTVRLAASLHQEATQWRWLAQHGLTEAVMRLDRTEAADAMLEALAAILPAGLDVARHALCHAPRIECSSDEAAATINRFLELGLLQWSFPLTEGSPAWDSELLHLLDGLSLPAAHPLPATLRSARACVTTYATTPAAGRDGVREQLHAAWTRWAEQAGVDTRKLPPTLHYEDATADAHVELSNTPDVQACIRTLGELVAHLRGCAWPADDQAVLRAYFDEHFAREISVPLVTFYETYQRLQRAREVPTPTGADRATIPRTPGSPTDGSGSAPLAIALRRQRVLDLRARLAARVAAAPGAEEVALTRQDLRAAFGDLVAPTAAPFTHSVFCHVDDESGASTRLVVPDGGASGGFAKYLSRFLHALPSAVQDRICEQVLPAREGVVAELSHDADFNANLHRPLVPFALTYPTREHRVAGTPLSCADLLVARDPESAVHLALVHRLTGARVWPVDIGFLNPMMRPALYRLLARFQSPSRTGLGLDHISLSTPCVTGGRDDALLAPLSPSGAGRPHDADAVLAAGGVLYRPRIVYEDRIVVARRRWTALGVALPQQAPQESDAEYFLRVTAWREERQIPVRLYARLRLPESGTLVPGGPQEESGGGEEQAVDAAPLRTATRTRRDDRKPQYLDLASPAFVRLFARLASTPVPMRVEFEECLPGRSSGVPWEGRPHHVEFVLHLQAADVRADRDAS